MSHVTPERGQGLAFIGLDVNQVTLKPVAQATSAERLLSNLWPCAAIGSIGRRCDYESIIAVSPLCHVHFLHAIHVHMASFNNSTSISYYVSARSQIGALRFCFHETVLKR